MIIQTNSFNLIVLLIYDFELEIILCEGILMQNAGEIRLLYFQKDDYRAYISLNVTYSLLASILIEFLKIELHFKCIINGLSKGSLLWIFL